MNTKYYIYYAHQVFSYSGKRLYQKGKFFPIMYNLCLRYFLLCVLALQQSNKMNKLVRCPAKTSRIYPEDKTDFHGEGHVHPLKPS